MIVTICSLLCRSCLETPSTLVNDLIKVFEDLPHAKLLTYKSSHSRFMLCEPGEKVARLQKRMMMFFGIRFSHCFSVETNHCVNRRGGSLVIHGILPATPVLC